MWKSDSDQNDSGLNGKTGSFDAIAWTEAEKQQNPNQRGTVRPTSIGHTLEYAGGTPFFLLADTHWGLSTFRYRFKGVEYTGSNIPITCGGVQVNSGDIISADDDGVLVLPKEKITPVLYLAEIILHKDQKARAQTYKKYGIKTDDTLGDYKHIA